MRISGWICLVLGIIGYLGAVVGGDTGFGPTFLIALGAFLLYRANNRDVDRAVAQQLVEKKDDLVIEQKEDKKEGRTQNQSSASDVVASKDSFDGICLYDDICDNPADNQPIKAADSPNDGQESVQDIQDQMTLEQREAAMSLITYFAGPIDETNVNSGGLFLYNQAAYVFGMSRSMVSLIQMMCLITDFKEFVNIARTITSLKAKEFLLLTCYDLANISGNPSKMRIFTQTAADMGYDSEKLRKLVSQYKRSQTQ